MIEFSLQTDGQHTLHVGAETTAELTELIPAVKGLYQKLLTEFGGPALPRTGQGATGERVDSVKQAQGAVAPRCPTHNVALVYRKGRRGPFWSCPMRESDGTWCKHTQNVSPSEGGQG